MLEKQLTAFQTDVSSTVADAKAGFDAMLDEIRKSQGSTVPQIRRIIMLQEDTATSLSGIRHLAKGQIAIVSNQGALMKKISETDTPIAESTSVSTVAACSVCTDEPPTVVCAGCCGKIYCDACDGWVHQKKTNHVRRKLVSSDATPTPMPMLVGGSTSAGGGAPASSPSVAVPVVKLAVVRHTRKGGLETFYEPEVTIYSLEQKRSWVDFGKWWQQRRIYICKDTGNEIVEPSLEDREMATAGTKWRGTCGNTNRKRIEVAHNQFDAIAYTSIHKQLNLGQAALFLDQHRAKLNEERSSSKPPLKSFSLNQHFKQVRAGHKEHAYWDVWNAARVKSHRQPPHNFAKG
jgi:hypothetical protein